jgi:hypothetical protein
MPPPPLFRFNSQNHSAPPSCFIIFINCNTADSSEEAIKENYETEEKNLVLHLKLCII